MYISLSIIYNYLSPFLFQFFVRVSEQTICFNWIFKISLSQLIPNLSFCCVHKFIFAMHKTLFVTVALPQSAIQSMGVQRGHKSGASSSLFFAPQLKSFLNEGFQNDFTLNCPDYLYCS